MALPDPAHAAGGDLKSLQPQFLFHTQGTMAGMVKGMIENRRLDLFAYPVRMRSLRARQAVDEALGAIGLEVAPDLVELLARVAHQPAGLRNVVQILCKIEQGKLATCYLVLRGHVVSVGLMSVVVTSSKPPTERHGHTFKRTRSTLAVARPSKWPNCQVITKAGHNGGETGIRTLGTLAGTTVFETAPFNHSGTSPRYLRSYVVSSGAEHRQGVPGPQEAVWLFRQFLCGAEITPRSGRKGALFRHLSIDLRGVLTILPILNGGVFVKIPPFPLFQA
jgi:hypothetical protein